MSEKLEECKCDYSGKYGYYCWDSTGPPKYWKMRHANTSIDKARSFFATREGSVLIKCGNCGKELVREYEKKKQNTNEDRQAEKQKTSLAHEAREGWRP